MIFFHAEALRKLIKIKRTYYKTSANPAPLREKTFPQKQEAINNITVETNQLTGIIIEEGIKIHSDLGPGLFESVYEEILFYRLIKRGINVSRQVSVPVYYEEVKMEVGFRADLIVENLVIVEIKSIEVFSTCSP